MMYNLRVCGLLNPSYWPMIGFANLAVSGRNKHFICCQFSKSAPPIPPTPFHWLCSLIISYHLPGKMCSFCRAHSASLKQQHVPQAVKRGHPSELLSQWRSSLRTASFMGLGTTFAFGGLKYRRPSLSGK